MAPGYYWAQDRAESIRPFEIVKVVNVGYGERAVQSFGRIEYDQLEQWDFGPRVKGQDADSEA